MTATDERRRQKGEGGGEDEQSADLPAKICEPSTRPGAGADPAPVEQRGLGGGVGDGERTAPRPDVHFSLGPAEFVNMYLRYRLATCPTGFYPSSTPELNGPSVLTCEAWTKTTV